MYLYPEVRWKRGFRELLGPVRDHRERAALVDRQEAGRAFGRLKGKALEVAVQGESRGFNDLVQRLKRHFSPDHEEMYAQQLHALKKKAGQSWRTWHSKSES